MSVMSLFKAGKAIDTVTDAVVKGADALILTEEERLNYNLKAAELHLRLTEQVGKESTPTSISRRIVAMSVLLPFGLLKIGSAILYLIASVGNEINGALINVSLHWNTTSGDFNNAVAAVVIFYFGGHIASKIKN